MNYVARAGFLLVLVFATLVLVSKYDVNAEAPEQGRTAPAAGKWTLVTFAWGVTQRSWNYLKLNTTTGETFYNDSGTWKKYTDEGPLPAGDYEVQYVQAAGDTYGMVRIDKNSGRAWWLKGNAWTENKN